MIRYDYVEIDGIEYAVLDKEQQKELMKTKFDLLLRKSNIPDFYKTEVDFDDYIGEYSRPYVEEIQKIAKNIYNEKLKDISLYLYGTLNSSQKTASQCNFGKECIRQGLKVQYMNFGVFVSYLLKNQGYNVDEDAKKEINILKNSDIILLDDCFDSKKNITWGKNDLIVSEIDSFFRVALGNHKRFCLTSNFPIESVKESYGVSFFELLDRNFKTYQFLDSVKTVRKSRFENLELENI